MCHWLRDIINVEEIWMTILKNKEFSDLFIGSSQKVSANHRSENVEK